MTIARAKIFRSGNSQAIRLPREFAFAEGTELVIVRSGDVLTAYPATLTIPELIDTLAALPAPPTIERRDEEELGERDGL
jgi:antitoxin VapB